MHIEEDQSMSFIIILFILGCLMIKIPAGWALITLSFYFLYKKLSGS